MNWLHPNDLDQNRPENFLRGETCADCTLFWNDKEAGAIPIGVGGGIDPNLGSARIISSAGGTGMIAWWWRREKEPLPINS